MKNHALLMVLCCLLPVLIVAALPALGLKGDVSNVLFIAIMLLCPLMMLSGHRHGTDEEKDETADKKQKSHGCH